MSNFSFSHRIFYPFQDLSLDSSILKEFADDNFKFDEDSTKLSKQVENTERRGELLSMSDISFSHSVFKRLVLQNHKTQGLFGKGLPFKSGMGNIEDQRQNASESFVATREICC